MTKHNILTMAHILLLVLAVVSSGVGLYLTISLAVRIQKFENQEKIIEKPVFVTNENDFIYRMIFEGKENEIYTFYDTYTGNRKVTYSIISHALSYNIPVNYFMALAYTESRFTITAVGANADYEGKVSSYDYGLFQLNSRTYSNYSKDFLMTMENNVRMAAEHLYKDYIKYGSWYEALMSYNAGNTQVVKNITVRHFVSVMTWQKDISEKLITEFENVYFN